MNLKKYTRPIVYGGLDGIITTFSVVSGAVGGALLLQSIIILGFSNLLSDGFSMGAGDYLSATTEEHQSAKEAFKSALMTFLSFNVFGVIPLIAYIAIVQYIPSNIAFPIACIFVVLALALLGYTKSTLTHQSKLSAIVQTVIVGVIASVVAYFVGQWLTDATAWLATLTRK